MKTNRAKIILIIGIIILISIIIMLVYLQANRRNTNNINKKDTTTEIDSQIYETKKMTKEEIFTIIDKGCNSTSDVEIFDYSKHNEKGSGLFNFHAQGKYNELFDYINLNQYRDEGFIFSTYINTEDYVWGSFYQENLQRKVFILIDKKSGELISLNSDERQLIVYK